MNFNWLYKLYAWGIGYMIAVSVTLSIVAALAQYVVWLVVVIVLLVVARLVWWYTRW